MKKRNVRKPQTFDDRALKFMSYNSFIEICMYGQGVIRELSEIKKLHAWLGRCIAWMEQEQNKK